MPVGSRELLRFGWTLMMTLRYLRTGGGRALTCFNFSQSHWLLPTSAVPNTTSSSLQCTHLSVILSTVACFLSSALYKSRSIKQYGQCMGCYIKSLQGTVRCMVAIALDCIALHCIALYVVQVAAVDNSISSLASASIDCRRNIISNHGKYYLKSLSLTTSSSSCSSTLISWQNDAIARPWAFSGINIFKREI